MARTWESIICYEDRAAGFTTSRWRLAGVRTKAGGENTAGGVLWLEVTRAGDTATADLYADEGLGAAAKVATGSADVAGLDGTGASAAEVVLSAVNDSALSGSFRLHDLRADGACPVQVALCTDEDLDALWDGIEDLPGYDAAAGMAEFIRLAGEDVLARVAAVFREHLGGHGSAEAWFLVEADRAHPDLRRIANPAQLRAACACRALEIALGRCHQRGRSTMYSDLRDYFRREYDRAMGSLSLTVRGGAGGASAAGRGSVTRLSRA